MAKPFVGLNEDGEVIVCVFDMTATFEPFGMGGGQFHVMFTEPHGETHLYTGFNLLGGDNANKLLNQSLNYRFCTKDEEIDYASLVRQQMALANKIERLHWQVERQGH